MRLPLLPVLLIASTSCAVVPGPDTYPPARRGDQVDTYHGVEVADPYRWLEDPDSPETRAWVRAENELTEAYLHNIPARRLIRERLSELWNYERFSIPVRRGHAIFYSRNDGLQDQSVLFVDTGEGARVLLDPNRLSEDNTVSLASTVPSEDGRLLAYALSDGGSDWREWHVLEVATGRELEDTITRNKFGGLAWNEDGSGFYYPRFAVPGDGDELVAKNSPAEIAFHVLGTPETDDVTVVPAPTEEGISLSFRLTRDRRSMVLSRWNSHARRNELSLLALGNPDAEEIPVATGFDAQYAPIGDDGETLFVESNLDAPLGLVLAIPLATPSRENWRILIDEGEDAIEDVSLLGGRLFVRTMKDATSRVQVYGLDGKVERTVELPGLGTVRGFDGEFEDTEAFYSFTGTLVPTTIYRYDVASGTSQVYRRPAVDFDASRYETHQVFYKSKDGFTRVPMFITHRKGIVLDGSNPTYLYGYGGFNISLTPSFSVTNLVWLEMGGVLAIPNLRGGGEYGEAWHEAGTKLKKQNVFDDFSAAARWLIRNGYTTPERLAIGGGSNGGLLVGACMTQEPWLYGAALPAVGVLDMLRYHLFTIGWAWAGDYGTVDDPEEFKALYAYSPLHNIEEGTAYPATLITTADHDDRVVPAHSFKFAAALQHAQGGDAPILIRIETRAGHGAGKPTALRIQEAADRWAFLVKVFDLEVPWN